MNTSSIGEPSANHSYKYEYIDEVFVHVPVVAENTLPLDVETVGATVFTGFDTAG